MADSNQFANEEVKSSCVYPNRYRPRGIENQVSTLRKLFPELKEATFDKYAEGYRMLASLGEKEATPHVLPRHAEGWFAIPRWEAIADTYGEAVEKVIARLMQTRSIYDSRKNQLGSQYLRQDVRSIEFWKRLSEQQQGHNIVLTPAQFGLRHRGRSVRRVREKFYASEFGLGIFAVSIMLLTHPERIDSEEDLAVDCPGDDYSLEADGSFTCAPDWSFYNGWLGYLPKVISMYEGRYGSASAFLPK